MVVSHGSNSEDITLLDGMGGLTQGKGEENDEALQKYLSAEKEVNVRERNSKQFCLVLLRIGWHREGFGWTFSILF